MLNVTELVTFWIKIESGCGFRIFITVAALQSQHSVTLRSKTILHFLANGTTLRKMTIGNQIFWHAVFLLDRNRVCFIIMNRKYYHSYLNLEFLDKTDKFYKQNWINSALLLLLTFFCKSFNITNKEWLLMTWIERYSLSNRAPRGFIWSFTVHFQGTNFVMVAL